jgi:hypothetical protein
LNVHFWQDYVAFDWDGDGLPTSDRNSEIGVNDPTLYTINLDADLRRLIYGQMFLLRRHLYNTL